MTGGSDEIVVFMYLGNVGGLVYGLFQFFQIRTVLGTDANLAEYAFGLSGRLGVGVVVNFIPDDDNLLIGINGVDCSLLFFVKGVFVGQPEYDGRLLKFLECSFNSKLFNGIICSSDTGGINKPELDAINSRSVLNHIASGAVDVADDGSIFS